MEKHIDHWDMFSATDVAERKKRLLGGSVK